MLTAGFYLNIVDMNYLSSTLTNLASGLRIVYYLGTFLKRKKEEGKEAIKKPVSVDFLVRKFLVSKWGAIAQHNQQTPVQPGPWRQPAYYYADRREVLYLSCHQPFTLYVPRLPIIVIIQREAIFHPTQIIDDMEISWLTNISKDYLPG